MYDPKKDGISHINVYSQGKTELGQFLSNFTRSPIETEDGHFESIEGYWYWLLSGDENLRALHGYAAKKAGQEITQDYPSKNLVTFQDKITKAIIQKIETSNRAEDVVYCELPFTHYYNFGGKVVVPKQAQWVVNFLNSLRING